jgi:hypothetical protein
MSCTTATRGRPKLAFEDSSVKIKRRKSKELRKTVGFTKLAHANKMSLQTAGKTDAAGLFSETLETAQTTGLIIRKVWNVHAKYKNSKKAKMKHCNIFSIYHVIKAAKEHNF